MNRRKFTSLAALGAIAISTPGFIRFNGTAYEGDCQTTTDILGPFYRPNSPMRTNLVIEGQKGELIELRGEVLHKDCTTPYQGAKVELWHCSSDEIYDNDSEEFRYRGTTRCDDSGKYHFLTQMPVPYDAGGGNYRPAHFHMLISAPGYQSLVTQLYFTGDPYLEKDASSAHPTAKGRILEVATDDTGKKIVTFDVIMQEKLLLEPKAMKQMVGTYMEEGTDKKYVFFVQDGQLWKKNEVFGAGFDYVGDNTFLYPGTTPGSSHSLHFELGKNGKVTLTQTQVWGDNKRIKIARKVS
jgi:protocatechuate 3,4-dioxygenase beta subunit